MKHTMEIVIANSDHEIAFCYAAMKELRPDIEENRFVEKVRDLQQRGYQLLSLKVSDEVVAVAGFRIGESLAWQRYLYVDDLVTKASERSKGYGSALLEWLYQYARDNDCQQFHLDSGVQREAAHRFYQREGFQIPSYHFAKYVS